MKRTNQNNVIQRHANYHAADYAYLREKGYSDAEILAIWDRDAALGLPAQKHLTGPENA